jgi:hypothetical protein
LTIGKRGEDPETGLINEPLSPEENRSSSALYDEIDEDHKPLLSEILDSLKNQTAYRIHIDEGSARMHILYYNGTSGSFSSDDTAISTPHNFTAENSYEYRDGKIFKPDGTELFPD